MCMAGRVLKRIARENVNVSLTLPASLAGDRKFARQCGTQSVEKSDRVTGALVSNVTDISKCTMAWKFDQHFFTYCFDIKYRDAFKFFSYISQVLSCLYNQIIPVNDIIIIWKINC